MSGQLRSELLKQRTTRTNVWLLLSMVGLLAFVLLLHILALPTANIAGREGQLRLLGWGTNIGALFSALLGALSITSEIRHGTIRPTFLATPKRTSVIAAKVAASALAGVAIGLLAEALAAGMVSAGLAARTTHIMLSGGDYAQLLVGGGIAAALWAAIGVGVGAIVRNQVGMLVGLCVWLLLVENILVENVPWAGKFLPGASAGALAGASQAQTAAQLLAPVLGALLLAAYAAAAAAAGSLAAARRDVT
jgi:hypothetical protein